MGKGYLLSYLVSHLIPLLVFPSLLCVIPIFVYFIYQKYQVRNAIRNVPFSTIFSTDLNKVKKNLEFKSMVFNCILLLLSLETLTHFSLGISMIMQFDLDLSPFRYALTNCVNRSSSLQVIHSDPILLLVENVNVIFSSLIPLCASLSFIVIRRAFINLPYKNNVRKYCVYIFSRLFFMVMMSLSLHTLSIMLLLLFPLVLIDFCNCISSSRHLYILLKGRRDEAFYHSTRRDYMEKKIIAKQFLYAQIFSYFALSIYLLMEFLVYFQILIEFLYNPDFLHFVSFQYLPRFYLPFLCIASYAYNISNILQLFCAFSLLLYMFIAYLLICISILIKLLIKRKKFNHVNDWITRPLMERYRSSLEGRRIQERPPFIQAFRSYDIS